jgi:membrane protein CcdC involved in cytochrome C biogenesis
MIQMYNDSCLRLFVQTKVLKTTAHLPGVDMIILVREKESKTKLNDQKIVTASIFVLHYFWIFSTNFHIYKSSSRCVNSVCLSLFYCMIVRYF